MLLCAAIAVALSALVDRASCWNDAGHLAVALIADDHLDEGLKQRGVASSWPAIDWQN